MVTDYTGPWTTWRPWRSDAAEIDLHAGQLERDAQRSLQQWLEEEPRLRGHLRPAEADPERAVAELSVLIEVASAAVTGALGATAALPVATVIVNTGVLSALAQAVVAWRRVRDTQVAITATGPGGNVTLDDQRMDVLEDTLRRAAYPPGAGYGGVSPSAHVATPPSTAEILERGRVQHATGVAVGSELLPSLQQVVLRVGDLVKPNFARQAARAAHPVGEILTISGDTAMVRWTDLSVSTMSVTQLIRH
jgi:hypothetical protein